MRDRTPGRPPKSPARRRAGQREAGVTDLRGQGKLEVVAKLVEVLIGKRVVEDQDAGTTVGSSIARELRAVGCHPSALALEQLGARPSSEKSWKSTAGGHW